MKLNSLIKKEKIELDLYHSHKKINIFAEVIGKYFAVHKSLHNKKFFTITHIPTGTAVENSIKTRKTAIDWATGFDKMFLGKELEFSQTNGKKHERFKEKHDIYREERG